MSERTIMACIDGSAYAAAACDTAIWAAPLLDSPVSFLHVISRRKHAAATDYSGQIGLGTREHLMTELAELDGQRARLAQQRGKDMLAAARERAVAAGLAEPDRWQRNGELVDALHTFGDRLRLVVLGKRGESAGDDAHLGSNLERVVRHVNCPILITTEAFAAPKRIMIAFDGSAAARRLIERAAANPLLARVACHLVHVGTPDAKRQRQIDAAADTLTAAGAELTVAVIDGDVEPGLHAYQRENDIDLMAMGAYGHSRIRALLVGSTTQTMIQRADVPVLIIR